MVSRDNVWRWLHDIPHGSTQSLPEGDSRPPRGWKRKMNRSQSPLKRQRIGDNEEILSDQSASVISELSEKTRLSQSQSTSTRTKRAASPVRKVLNDLRISRPAILCDIPFTVALPERAKHVYNIIDKSRYEGVIPAQLQDRIHTAFPLAAESIPGSAYDYSKTYSDRELDSLWEPVLEILDEAGDCSRHQQDENQWCSNVVHPILRLALKGSMLKVQNVQTQTINADLLPITPNNYRIRKKADYAFSFHRNANIASEVYRKLALAGKGDMLSHTMDATTQCLVLFSGLEVKHENGGKDEALAQLATWLGAGMQHLKNLRSLTGLNLYSYSDLPPMVGWTIIGHDWYTYIAFGATADDDDQIHILGPWRAAETDTRDVYGLFKLLKLLKETVEYATTIHWPWLLENILQPLCSTNTGPRQ